MPSWGRSTKPRLRGNRDGPVDFRAAIRRVEQAFDELAERLLEAKKQYSDVKSLDEALFARDFEV